MKLIQIINEQVNTLSLFEQELKLAYEQHLENLKEQENKDTLKKRFNKLDEDLTKDYQMASKGLGDAQADAQQEQMRRREQLRQKQQSQVKRKVYVVMNNGKLLSDQPVTLDADDKIRLGNKTYVLKVPYRELRDHNGIKVVKSSQLARDTNTIDMDSVPLPN